MEDEEDMDGDARVEPVTPPGEPSGAALGLQQASRDRPDRTDGWTEGWT